MVMQLHVGLAAVLILGAGLSAWQLRPWARRHPQWASLARLALAAAAAGLMPVRVLPACLHLCSAVNLLMTTEAFALLALALLLPLPLGRHLWVQATALLMFLARLLPLARLHVELPGRGAECLDFVCSVRQAMPAVVPGASATAPEPTLLRCCWMAHAWVIVMAGFMAPTAMQAALWQHHRRLAQMQEEEDAQQRAGQLPGGASGREPTTPDQPPNTATAAAPPALPSPPDLMAARKDNGASSSTDPRAGLRSRRQPAEDSSMQDGSLPAPEEDEDGKRAAARRRESQLTARVFLVGYLAHWLLLLLPLGALAWALLELLAPNL